MPGTVRQPRWRHRRAQASQGRRQARADADHRPASTRGARRHAASVGAVVPRRQRPRPGAASPSSPVRRAASLRRSRMPAGCGFKHDRASCPTRWCATSSAPLRRRSSPAGWLDSTSARAIRTRASAPRKKGLGAAERGQHGRGHTSQHQRTSWCTAPRQRFAVHQPRPDARPIRHHRMSTYAATRSSVPCVVAGLGAFPELLGPPQRLIATAGSPGRWRTRCAGNAVRDRSGPMTSPDLARIARAVRACTALGAAAAAVGQTRRMLWMGM